MARNRRAEVEDGKMASYELRFGMQSAILIGVAKPYRDGWKFFPRMSGRAPSRKVHPTALDSLPRWALKYMPEHGGEWRRVDG